MTFHARKILCPFPFWNKGVCVRSFEKPSHPPSSVKKCRCTVDLSAMGSDASTQLLYLKRKFSSLVWVGGSPHCKGCDDRKVHEHQAEQTVRACDNDGRGLREAFLRNTVGTSEHATSSKDRENACDKLETNVHSVNTLHNWFHKKRKNVEECSQESITSTPRSQEQH